MNKQLPTIICMDEWENYCCAGDTIDDAYLNYCNFHGNVDIEKLVFYTATQMPAQKGKDYD